MKGAVALTVIGSGLPMQRPLKPPAPAPISKSRRTKGTAFEPRRPETNT